LGAELGWWIHLLIVLLIVAEIGRRAVFAYLGTEIIVPKVGEMTKFSLVEHTAEHLVIGATIPFANEGKQCGTIMDAFLRVPLPYEQYDGALVRGKVELAGAPREDDYFEAVLIQKHSRIHLILKVSIEGRRGNSLEEAIAHLPDLRLDLIYQETGRIPAHYSKVMLKVAAQEIADLAGIAIAREGGEKNG